MALGRTPVQCNLGRTESAVTPQVSAIWRSNVASPSPGILSTRHPKTHAMQDAAPALGRRYKSVQYAKKGSSFAPQSNETAGVSVGRRSGATVTRDTAGALGGESNATGDRTMAAERCYSSPGLTSCTVYRCTIQLGDIGGWHEP
jgi:hypothetical protein